MGDPPFVVVSRPPEFFFAANSEPNVFGCVYLH
jgi:hypothetical protein